MGALLFPGDIAPWFKAATPGNSNYHFNTVAGRHVLLGFLPADSAARERAAEVFLAQRHRFDDLNLTAFLVVSEPASIATARNQLPGLRWFLDADRSLSRLYGAWDDQTGEHAHWLLLDPALRVIANAPTAAPEAVFDAIASLPDLADPALPCAPVLIAPRILEPELCHRLIAYYQADGGEPSGVMRDVNGRTVGIFDSSKRRRDTTITDDALRNELLTCVTRRLLPEIEKVYQFRATRLERYIVACYDAADGGYFRAHRDDESFGTAHRRFAVTINLNAEEFEGGELRFPEFGRRTYRAPTGGAVVFACGLQHEALPVTKGRRYAFLPFLYDDEGARIRQENLALLDLTGAK